MSYSCFDEMKWQLLHKACWDGDAREVTRLLDAGANPNQVAPTSWRQTPLGRTLEYRITGRSRYACRMSRLDRITVDPAICHGKPCVRGRRYPVEVILDLLASGMTNHEILADYPDLEMDDILAVLEYAAVATRIGTVLPIPAA